VWLVPVVAFLVALLAFASAGADDSPKAPVTPKADAPLGVMAEGDAGPAPAPARVVLADVPELPAPLAKPRRVKRREPAPPPPTAAVVVVVPTPEPPAAAPQTPAVEAPVYTPAPTPRPAPAPRPTPAPTFDDSGSGPEFDGASGSP